MKYVTCGLIALLWGGGFYAWSNPGSWEQTDALFQAGNYVECRTILEKELLQATTNADKTEIYWRLSRVWYYLAEQDRNRTEDAALVSRGNEKGAAFADEAIKLDGRSFTAFFWRSANWGSWVQQNPNLSALGRLNLAREDLIRVLNLKPDYPEAYYALGTLYANVPGWPLSFGNKEYGISLMRRAVDTIGDRPEVLRGYISLAGALWERNWDSRTRAEKMPPMREEFAKRTLPVERYCFYEGIMNFSAIPVYAGKPFSALSDREEARLMLAFAENMIARVAVNPAERDALRHAVKRVRAKWK